MPITAVAQTVTASSILSGRVLDAKAQPLPGATLRLLHLPDSALTTASQSDEAGRYQLTSVSTGRYLLRATAIGLKPTSTVVNLRADQPVQLPDITLLEDSKLLREVTVTGQQKATELVDGKLVYNVDQQVSTAGSTALEVLRRAPGVSVSQNDEILLRGNANVNIMLDGKLTYLSPQQLSTYLKSTPASNLARIEVLLTPDSRYDASGNAGIINIITKKSTTKGYALNLTAGGGGGYYPQTAESLIGNVKTGRVNVFGNYAYTYRHSYLDRTSFRVLGTGNMATTFDRRSRDPEISRGHSYKAGLDVEVTPHQTLGFVYSGFNNRWQRDGQGPTRIRHVSSGVEDVLRNHNITDEPARQNLFNLNYKATLDTLGRQLTADADYARYASTSDGFLANQQFNAQGEATEPYQRINFTQPTDITIRSLKADLTWPLPALKLAGGVKYSAVRADNNFRYDSLRNGERVFSSVLSNHFVYQEHIYAAYLTAGRQVGKMSLDAGLRLERTRSAGNSLNLQQINRRDYTNLFPYLSIGRKLGERHALNVSATRRINRPQYGALNPARFFFDRYSYHEGNPYLQPETSWNYAAAYAYREDYSFTLSHTRVSRAIAQFARQNEQTGEIVLRDYHYASREDYDLLMVVPLKLASFWSVQNTVDVRYQRLRFRPEENIVFKPSRLSVDLSVIQTLQLPWSFTLDVSTFYQSPMLNGSYLLRRYFGVQTGLKKSFFKNKLDAKLAVVDLLHTDHYWGYSIYEPINIRYNHTGDTRRANVSLTYRLGGKLSAGQSRRLEEAGRIR
jgi:outer membrane receptor protein involved in Fe transport